jgi:hypothetical protein
MPAALSKPLAEYAPAALYNGWNDAASVKKIPTIKSQFQEVVLSDGRLSYEMKPTYPNVFPRMNSKIPAMSKRGPPMKQ